MERKVQKMKGARSLRRKTTSLLAVGLGMVFLFSGCAKEKPPTADDIPDMIMTEREEAAAKEVPMSIEELGLPEPVRPEAAKIYDVEPVHLSPQKEPAGSGLPRVDIELPEDYLLSREEYTKGTIAISKTEGYDLPAAPGKVRIRGNSTAHAAKKALKVRFDEKQSIFGHNAEKTWTLLANAFDKTSLHNAVSMDLYDYLTPAGTFVPMCRFVDVYVNGDYQGVYNLCDQVETGDARVAISGKIASDPELCDYLMVVDYRASAEQPEGEGLEWFWLKWTNDLIEVKSPETRDGRTKEQVAYLKDYLDRTYEAIKLKDWDEIQKRMDVDSFMRGLLTAEITNNTDIAQASMYMYKTAMGKLTFGPSWDFDMAFGSCVDGYEGAVDYMGTQNNVFFGELMNVPEFRKMYTDFFREHYDEILNHLLEKIDEEEAELSAVLENEYEIWTKNYDYNIPEMNELSSHAEQVEFMKTWTKERMEFLKKNYRR